MSPVKNKEDTWKASELEKHIKTMKGDKGSSSRSKRHDDDRDKQEKRHRDDSVKKHRGEDDKRSRDDKERRHRDDREGRPQDDSDRRRRDDEKTHRDGSDREKTRTSKTKESRDTDKRSPSKHRDEDDDERRRRREERKRREAEEAGGGDREHRKHRDKSDRDTDGKRHRDRDDGEKRRDREKDDKHDERREKHRTKQEESESKSRKKEEKEQSKDDDPERRHRRHKEDGDSRHRATSDRGDSESRHRKQRDKHQEEDDRGRDDTERDSRKHRREKERAGGEDVDSDGKGGKSEKPEKEERRKKRAEPEKEKNYDEYEDDFEAYEDDFAEASEDSGASDEDEEEEREVRRKPKKTDRSRDSESGRSAESGKEMDDILRALDEENKRLLSSPIREEEDERRQNKKKKESLLPADRPTFINFVSAKQRTVTGKTSQKIRTRAKDLLNLIEFDAVSFTLFEQHSEKEYDRFIRSFGRMNAMQAYVQTNEDNLDQEIQTEEIELREKWSQHPPEAGIPPCGGDSDQSTSADFGQLIYKVPWDVALDKGIRVIETLLEENNMEYMHKNVGHKQSNIIVSEAFVELTSVSILKGRHVVYSQFSPDQNHLLLAAYSRSDKNSEESNPLKTKGVVCIWNVYEPSRPQKILLCPSQLLCGCFSPVKSTLVFAGLEDGVIVTWDLREPDSLHKRVTYDNVEYVLRHPTYNTALPYLHDSHSSPVIKLTPIVSNASKSSVSPSTTAEECLSFQLASLEQNSVIVLWVVVELDRPDPVGMTSDYGLREGGRVKLVKSSVIKLESPRSVRNSVLETTFECTDLQVWPKDNSQYIVATTSTGCVLHATRHGGHISPKAFRPKSDYPFDITSIDFSPFLSSVFLAGGSDGSMRLFRVDLSHALMTWYDATNGCSIRMVRWCRSRPSVFFVLDEDSFIYIWDLHMDDSCALKKERIATSRVTSICLSNDHSATGQGLPDRPPQMAVFLETGVTEAHIIKKEFSALMPEEIRQFSAFIGKAIL